MTSPPQNINDWLQGGPWKIVNTEFWRKVRKHIKGTESLKPFVIHNGLLDRTHHELAHFICCDDRDLFDPTYGIPEFLTDTDRKSRLSTNSFLKEIEVVYVEKLLTAHMSSDFFKDVYVLYYIRDVGMIPEKYLKRFRIHKHESEMEFYSRIEEKFIREYIANVVEPVWDIEAAWMELQRKYALVSRHQG